VFFSPGKGELDTLNAMTDLSSGLPRQKSAAAEESRGPADWNNQFVQSLTEVYS
jgi:hypothetical protein